MNLRELLQRVEDYTDHEPDIRAHRAEISRFLSESHRVLCMQDPWSFRRRRSPFWQYPDALWTASVEDNTTTQLQLLLSNATSSWVTAFRTTALKWTLEDWGELWEDLLGSEGIWPQAVP